MGQGMTLKIICADALPWRAESGVRGPVATSLPDADEIGMGIDAWRDWFIAAAAACMRMACDGDRVIFYQTDRKEGGGTHSKAALLISAAESAGSRLLWHKIALRRDVGVVDLHRPGFSHVMAFGRNAKPGRATPDAFMAGNPAYKNGLGENAARLMVAEAAKQGAPMIDPFCGRGGLLRVAMDLGFDAIGVDIDAAQCAAALDYCSPNLLTMAA